MNIRRLCALQVSFILKSCFVVLSMIIVVLLRFSTLTVFRCVLFTLLVLLTFSMTKPDVTGVKVDSEFNTSFP